MAWQQVPNTAEAVITYSGHGKTFKNVVHGFKSGGYVEADLVTLAEAIGLAVVTNWLPIQSLDYLYLNTTVRGLNLENDLEVVDATGSAVGGTGGAGMPDNVTLAVKKASAFTGRTARGRLYWIGTPAVKIASNENQYNVAAADDIRDAIEDVRIAINATVWEATIVSRFSNGTKRAFGITTPWVDSVLVDINVDSQRRRLL